MPSFVAMAARPAREIYLAESKRVELLQAVKPFTVFKTDKHATCGPL